MGYSISLWILIPFLQNPLCRKLISGPPQGCSWLAFSRLLFKSCDALIDSIIAYAKRSYMPASWHFVFASLQLGLYNVGISVNNKPKNLMTCATNKWNSLIELVIKVFFCISFIHSQVNVGDDHGNKKL